MERFVRGIILYKIGHLSNSKVEEVKETLVAIIRE